MSIRDCEYREDEDWTAIACQNKPQREAAHSHFGEYGYCEENKVCQEDLKTSLEWLDEDEFNQIIIMDPDGWDRSNYKYSFEEEKISKNEFNKRLMYSTCMTQPKEK